jgi:hypothetical protein
MDGNHRCGKAGGGDPRGQAGMTAMDGLYGRYHGRILRLARVSTDNGAWKAKLREILAEFDEDCRRLPVFGRDALRNELASQIELEALRFSDPDKRAVLTLALKHFDAGEP